MLKLWDLQIKGLHICWLSNFENYPTLGGLKPGPNALAHTLAGMVKAADFFLRTPSLTNVLIPLYLVMVNWIFFYFALKNRHTRVNQTLKASLFSVCCCNTCQLLRDWPFMKCNPSPGNFWADFLFSSTALLLSSELNLIWLDVHQDKQFWFCY